MAIDLDSRGPLHTESGPQIFWSRTNVGEALPGVASPLGWSLWGPAVDVGVRDCFARMGALPQSDVEIQSDPRRAVTAVFYGRAALNVNFLAEMGSVLPGVAPDAIVRQLLGAVPENLQLTNSWHRIYAIAAKMPYALATIRWDVLARTGPIKAWWQAWTTRFDSLDETEARIALAEGRDRFFEMIRVQAGGVFIAVQSVHNQLTALIEKSDLEHAQANALVSGHGSHAETEIILDLWRMGRGQLDLDGFLSLHGYHGPLEGEVSSHIWREDTTPVLRLAEQYSKRDASQDPLLSADLRKAAREQAERELLAGLPVIHRPFAKLVLKMAVSRIPLRGVAKAAYLQSLDVARGAARRYGILMAEAGKLDDPEDVFLFPVNELVEGLPANAKELAAARREQHEAFKRHDIPTHWRGNPVPFEIASADAPAEHASSVHGIGASGGMVEGIVRIVHDPAFTDIEPDEVLVCVTTDPSWASALFLSSALVVDIGGMLSHAAVVAREVGVPCVIGTGNGTKALRTGDRVRVNGNEGTVEILERATAEPPSSIQTEEKRSIRA
ncbi:PEP-utilizing protein mobile subunit [Halopseudomonas bauzanensis]|nr:PEP-utilizing protein mobile subunit [Halopseudomonas bauzanensis]